VRRKDLGASPFDDYWSIKSVKVSGHNDPVDEMLLRLREKGRTLGTLPSAARGRRRNASRAVGEGPRVRGSPAVAAVE